jgi:Mn2+/Fe2+ NRAMP family transporter
MEAMPKAEAERRLLQEARARGPAATIAAFVRLSGPGWLQSAITLGGGSLAGSLYLGVIAGYQFMWLQPFMMVLGILMLSVIAYVTLSTGERPFGAINRHVNPVLGWGWLVAAMMANMVWAMPQFSLGTAALEQNLLPGVFGGKDGPYLAAGLLFAVGAAVVWAYEAGGRGVKIFEGVLKAMVGIVVLSFFGVVLAMTLKGGLAWGDIFAGFVPDVGLLWTPAEKLQPLIAASGDPAYWKDQILTSQRQRMIAAAATAVGINMTFLLPYSMLRKGWDRDFRGLATFDLSTGLFIPFMLATSCVVIAAAAQFHGKVDAALIEAPASEAKGSYRKNLEARLKAGATAEGFERMSPEERKAALDALPRADRELAAALMSRDALDLAKSLEGLTGPGIAHVVFGIGVLGMAVSTIIILMLINGFCLTEACGRPSGGRLHLAGALLPGLTGSLGFLFLWGNAEARFWLAVPTSNFGMILLPVAYVTFFFMINNRGLMGDQMPGGARRALLNAAMAAAIGVATVGSAISLWNAREKIPGTSVETRWPLLAGAAAFVGAAVVVGVRKRARDPKPAP